MTSNIDLILIDTTEGPDVVNLGKSSGELETGSIVAIAVGTISGI